MNYNEFKKVLFEELKKAVENNEIPDVTNITESKTTKNNCNLDSIIFNKGRFNPVIYVKNFYEIKDQGIENIVKNIIKIISESEEPESIKAFINNNYKKENIIFAMIGKKNNEKLLSEIPYMTIEDLAVYYRIIIDTSDKGMSSFIITNEHLKSMNLTNEELYSIAYENTRKLLGVNCKSMKEIIQKIIFGNNDEESELKLDSSLNLDIELDSEMPMYVLSNNCNINGAVNILYTDILEMLAEQFNDDLYILPSSIHETIIIPKSINGDVTELINMVKMINATELAIEDILSDNVYTYIRNQKNFYKSSVE